MIDGLLPKSLFSWSKMFFDKSKACSRRVSATLHFVSKLALRAQTIEVADLPLRQDLLEAISKPFDESILTIFAKSSYRSGA